MPENPTRALLTCGAVAGPLYVAVVLLQMPIRDGFDIGRHPASLLSNGDLGWIQIANFAITGLLLVAGAAGLRRAGGGAWGPRLIGVFGAGMVAAAVFRADPVDGFPPGTPLGPPTTVSTQGLLHFLVAAVAFLALASACFVYARRFRPVLCRATGVLFLAGWLSAFTGSRAANIAFALVIALAMAWTTLLHTHYVGIRDEDRSLT
jgi:hypothetical protein